MKNYMIIKQPIGDLAQFLEQFKALQPLRKEHGMTDIDMLHSADEPNKVIIMIEYENLEHAKAYWDSKGLAEARKKAGVVHRSEQVWYTGSRVE